VGSARWKFIGAVLAAACLAIAGCRAPARGGAPGRAASKDAPAFVLGLTAPRSEGDPPLPRELAETPLGLGMTLAETVTRLPELRPDAEPEFAAPPPYYVCDEILAAREFIRLQPGKAVTLRARPAGGDLGAVELYAFDGAISALRGLYSQDDVKSVPYRDFVARALTRYGSATRSESLSYSDGTIVRYTLWQTPKTTILVGETDVPDEAPVSRYIYVIDGDLLRASFRAAAGRRFELSQRPLF